MTARLYRLQDYRLSLPRSLPGGDNGPLTPLPEARSPVSQSPVFRLAAVWAALPLLTWGLFLAQLMETVE